MRNKSGIYPVTHDIGGVNVVFFGDGDGNMDVKFNRSTAVAKRYNTIKEKLIANTSKSNPSSPIFRASVALLVILDSGIRVGNESSAEGYYTVPHPNQKDTESKFVKTYGITTMLPEHAKVVDGLVHFDFVGKKQVQNTFMLDPFLSSLVVKIMETSKDTLFNVSEPDLTKFIKQETSPYLSAKDFRTFRANVFAYNSAKGKAKPQKKSEYNKVINSVAEDVSVLLNNTPQVCKRSYIDNRLFTHVFGDKSEL